MTNKEAIEQLKWVGNRICQITCLPETFDALNLAIKALEETPQGEWINRETGCNTLYPFWERYECNQCHKFNGYYNFCPNCGADMRGEEK